MMEMEKMGSISISFSFKNVMDKANFSDYKPRTSPAEEKISTSYDK